MAGETDKKKSMGMMTVQEQKKIHSVTWWIGMAACIVQGLCAVGIAAKWITPDVAAAITAMFAGVFAYCNGNNPNIKGKY